MNGLNSILISFCVSCILMGTLYIICPEGKLSKPLQYIFGLLFVVTVISAAKLPFIGNINFTPTEISTENYEEMEISSAKYVFSYVLTKSGINFKEISLCTDNLPDGSIVISKVIINSDCENQEIIKALGDLTKTREVEIINE